MTDIIWCYEKDIQDDPDKRWPLCPAEFYEVEINFDFTDEDRISEIAEDVEKMGADSGSTLVVPTAHRQIVPYPAVKFGASPHSHSAVLIVTENLIF
jgi:hypothetical protein